MPWLVSIFVALASSCYNRSFAGAADPTLGFAAVELTEDRFKPYDLPPEQRYEFCDGVRRKWVYCTDKPFSPGSPTKPRSEILLNNRSVRKTRMFSLVGTPGCEKDRCRCRRGRYGENF
ncbi:hypothetical protein HU200_059674 [Digitaria exilis]|uniref:Uncharacterized protein n=1 Tax=Digitaria exilis TaxID=1010633 RepID=A0A835AB71_9POAL|nr:hypothetical protein HU200_059674 [Digitaria exilis]